MCEVEPMTEMTEIKKTDTRTMFRNEVEAVKRARGEIEIKKTYGGKIEKTYGSYSSDDEWAIFLALIKEKKSKAYWRLFFVHGNECDRTLHRSPLSLERMLKSFNAVVLAEDPVKTFRNERGEIDKESIKIGKN